MRAGRLRRTVTALWATHEGVVGGVLHGLKLPLKGVVLGGGAAICLSVLAYFRRQRGDQLRATGVVLALKAAMSPHSSLGGFIAVALQGLVAEAVFFFRGAYAVSAVLMCILALLLSALQKLVMVTLVFGLDIWKLADGLLELVAKQMNLTYIPGSYELLGYYLFLQVLLGMMIGLVAAALPMRLQTYRKRFPGLVLQEAVLDTFPVAERRKHKLGLAFFVLAVLAVLLLLNSLFPETFAFAPRDNVGITLLRGIVVLALWYGWLGPRVQAWLVQRLAAVPADGPLGSALQEVTQLLPDVRSMVSACWVRSRSLGHGLGRVLWFWRLVAVNVLAAPLSTRLDGRLMRE